MSEIQETGKPEAESRPEFRYIVSVRFKNSKKAYTFGTNDETIEYGDYVVVETARGMEMGEIISSLRDVSLHTQRTPLKAIVRKATRRDRENYAQNRQMAKEALAHCQAAVSRLKLDMNLISCEYTLDRSKIIFVYVADERVDFRELLKDLAGIFKCRIELRQIGPRDKAKIIGGLGTCGMETCCSRFMDDFDVVSINMAKNQLLALNIQKLSGQCGKLMCCLKFEDDNYKQLRQGLPKMNAQVEYEGKLYRVTSMNVISGQAKIENRENAQFISLTDLVEKGVFRRPEPQGKRQEGKPAEIQKPIEKKEAVHRAESRRIEEKKPEVREETESRVKKEKSRENNQRRENKEVRANKENRRINPTREKAGKEPRETEKEAEKATEKQGEKRVRRRRSQHSRQNKEGKPEASRPDQTKPEESK